jgi:pimeloyl-ACP methyl ester carboxylesterase
MGALSTALGREGTYRAYAREALDAARCALWYPLGLGAGAFTTGDPTGDTTRDTPVILVHGYGHNRSGWLVLQRHLRRSGFTSVHTINYVPFVHDVPTLAGRLADRVAQVRALTGQERVHLVGHSLGGVLARWYVQELGGVAHVDTVVTVATPHEGTAMAWAPLGRAIRDLRPGSPVLRRLATGACRSDVRWVALYSNVDAFVSPARSAMIRHPQLRATNVLVRDHGHISIMVSQAVAETITTELTGRDPRAAVPAPVSTSARLAKPA